MVRTAATPVKTHHPPVEVDLIPAGHESGDASRKIDTQQLDADPRKRHRQGSADERKHEALGEKLADEAKTTGTESEPQGQFLLSIRPSSEHQIGNVHTGDEEDEKDRGLEYTDEGGSPHIDDRSIQRLSSNAVTRVRLRVLSPQPGRDQVHLTLRVLNRNAVFHAADDGQIIPIPPLRFLGIEMEGCPEVGTPRVLEAGGGDANDLIVFTVQEQSLS